MSATKREPVSPLLSYLRLSGLKVGLILNFNVPRLTRGIHRVVNDLKQ
jgi:hypothetical protein